MSRLLKENAHCMISIPDKLSIKSFTFNMLPITSACILTFQLGVCCGGIKEDYFKEKIKLLEETTIKVAMVDKYLISTVEKLVDNNNLCISLHYAARMSVLDNLKPNQKGRVMDVENAIIAIMKREYSLHSISNKKDVKNGSNKSN